MAQLSSLMGDDPDLQVILNEVLDSIPEAAGNSAFDPDFENLLGLSQSQTAQFQQDVEKKLAINAIQQQLMQCESNAYSGSPPAYPMHSAMAAQQMGNFPPPPNYPNQPNQRRIPMTQTQGGANQGLTAAATARLLNQNSMQQRKIVAMEKERLLRQQQCQKIVGPSNATTSGAETICNYPFFYCFFIIYF